MLCKYAHTHVQTDKEIHVANKTIKWHVNQNKPVLLLNKLLVLLRALLEGIPGTRTTHTHTHKHTHTHRETFLDFRKLINTFIQPEQSPSNSAGHTMG